MPVASGKRFATQEQLDFVENLETEISDYQQIFVDIVNTFAGYIEAVSEDSGIETRIVSSNGRDDEKWRGALLSASKTKTEVNVWYITFSQSDFLTEEENEPNSFNKPFSLGIDFFFDYKFGTDLENSEQTFNEKVTAFEFIIETIRNNAESDCLPHGCQIESGSIKRGIKRFNNASTHFAKGDFNLMLEGL